MDLAMVKCPHCRGRGFVYSKQPGFRDTPEITQRIECPQCRGMKTVPEVQVSAEREYRRLIHFAWALRYINWGNMAHKGGGA